MRSAVLFIFLCILLTTSMQWDSLSHAASIDLDEDTGEIIILDKEQEEKKQKTTRPKTPDEYATLYFKACLDQRNALLTGEAQELFCGCSAGNIPRVMSMRDIAALGTATAEGKFQKKRMLLFISAPCMAPTLRSLSIGQCLDGAIKNNFRDPSGTCGCLGHRVENYIALEASKIVEREQSFRSEDVDPVKFLLESPEVQAHYEYLMKECITIHEG